MNILHSIILTGGILAGLLGCHGSPSPPPGDATTTDAMLQAAEQGDLQTLDQLLVRHRRSDVRDSCDWTPLMKAALNGHRAVVERLLAAGAAVDAVDKGGYTSMMLAASNNHAEVVELLLQRGAMIDHQEGTEAGQRSSGPPSRATATRWPPCCATRPTARYATSPARPPRTGRARPDVPRSCSCSSRTPPRDPETSALLGPRPDPR